MTKKQFNEIEWAESYLKCECSQKKPLLFEYDGMHPQHYDGVSEVRCQICGKRWGRWTRKELKENEYEPRYGIVPK